MEYTAKSLVKMSQSLTLSAYETTKLVCGLLTLQNETVAAYTAFIEGQQHYLVSGLGSWFDCGVCNNYHATLKILANDEAFIELTDLDVPILNADQLRFMCMDNAHFDHC